MDNDKIKQAVKLFLEAIDEDPTREGLVDTPDRVVRMMDEILGGASRDTDKHFDKVFTSKNTELVVEKDIEFFSVCEHHLLPFFGTMHVGYVPDGKVIGLSKIARVVDDFARRLQIQEQLTAQVAYEFMEKLAPKGVIVCSKAEHLCMTMRGVKKTGSSTVCYTKLGCFETDNELTERFFELIK